MADLDQDGDWAVEQARRIRQAVKDELTPQSQDEEFLRRSREALKAAGLDKIDLTGRGRTE